jgi:hypothetical protein
MKAPKKTAPPAPEKPQSQRFIDFAKEHGADDPKALDRALGEIAGGPKPPKPDKS